MDNPPLPKDFEGNMRALLGGEADEFFAALDLPPVRALRLNPLRQGAFSAASEYLEESVPWTQNGYYIREGTAPGADILHACGAYYIQDASAMAPVCALSPRPGMRILDLCAAPGGKSGQIAEQIGPSGLLISNEMVPGRAKVLAGNLERLGASGALVTCESPERLAQRLPGFFDGVLVDAPCSGEGMFRRVPASRQEWSPEGVLGCAHRQADILRCAAQMVRPGGRLVYATCTLNRTENEEVISSFLRAHPQFQLDAPDPALFPGAENREGIFRMWPHRLRGEGQSFCRLARKGALPDPEIPKSAAPLKAPFEFLARSPLFLAHHSVLKQGEYWLSRPMGAPDLSGLRMVSDGVMLARAGRSHTQPMHQLAMALRMGEAQACVSLTRQQAASYLSGQALPHPGSGYALAAYMDMPLGWGKLSGGLFKNLLPKGLRMPLRP